jgi:hypothetical protein
MKEDELRADLIDIAKKYTYGDEEAAMDIGNEIFDHLLAMDIIYLRADGVIEQWEEGI